jgi:membrane protein implicated in regulation of membrane protease activity
VTRDDVASAPRKVMDIRRSLIILGIVLLLTGLLWPLLSRLGLGRLPGDIAIERGNFRFYFPLVSSLVVSVVLTLLLWLFRR